MSDELGIGKVHAAIVAVMAEVGGIAKTRKNEQQGYKFRGIADITKACQPLMAKHLIHVTPHAVLEESVLERPTKSGGVMLHVRQKIQFRFYHADGSYVPCTTTGEAMDSGDKTSNKVMSAALKYALTQTFCIPEEDPDADTETASPEFVAPAAAPEPPAPPSGDAGLILDLAAEIQQLDGGTIDGIVYMHSAFPGKEGKEMSFTDPTKVRSAKWLAGTRGKLESTLHKLRAKSEPGAAEAAKAFKATDEDVPF